MKFLTRILVFIALSALAACGGDGSSSNQSSDGDAASTRFNISGTVTAARFSAVDSDTNDNQAPSSTNDAADYAQLPGNPSVLGGFVSAEGSGEAGQRFSSSADREDWFRISASPGQSLDLHIHKFDSGDQAAVDLDLYLYSPDDTSNPIESSTGTGASESIAIPSEGDFLLRVAARAGISNYTLKLDSGNGTAASPSVSQEFIPGEMVIKWTSPPSAQWLAARGLEPLVEESAADTAVYRLIREDLSPIVAEMEFLHLTARESLKRKLRTLAAIKSLQSTDLVEWAEPNYLYRSALTPDDRKNHLQWHYRRIRLPQAWDVTTGSSDVIVAVLDSGIFSSHPDLRGKLVDGYDFVSDAEQAGDGDGIDGDPEEPAGTGNNWHGTHVSGTVGAVTDNGTGVSGAGWQSRIMPLRVLGKSGGSNADIAQAVRYAAGLSNNSDTLPARRADIINMSFGGAGRSQTLQDAIDDARSAGVIVVAAAGNDNSQAKYYPAALSGVVAVSATDYNGDKAPYSNFGSWIDLAAPGGNTSLDANGDGYGDGVISTHVEDGASPSASYSFMQGTSMASPHVAAVFALMKAEDGKLSPGKVDALLAQGKLTKDIGDTGEDRRFGMGQIDAYKAVRAAAGPVTVPVLAAEPDSLNFGSTHTALDVKIENIGAEGARISGVPTSAAEWISAVEAVDTDGDGFGRYRVRVSRAQLADGTYSSSIRFPVEGSSDFELRANMKVGGSDTGADAGYLYILLLKPGEDADGDGKPDDMEIVAQTAKTASGGKYQFDFSAVPAGEYLLAAGTDIDGDGYICGPGEACGMFPAKNFSNPVRLRKNLSGQNFTVSYDSGGGTGEQKHSAAQHAAPGPIRLRATASENGQ